MNYLNPTTLEELFRQDTLDYIEKHLLRYAPYVKLQPKLEHKILIITLCKVPIEQWEEPSLIAAGAIRSTIREIEGHLMLTARVMRWNPSIRRKDPHSLKPISLKTILDKVTIFIQKSWEPF